MIFVDILQMDTSSLMPPLMAAESLQKKFYKFIDSTWEHLTLTSFSSLDHLMNE